MSIWFDDVSPDITIHEDGPDIRVDIIEGTVYEGDQGSGTTDHAQLINRDASNQHPIGSIFGLSETLSGKSPVEHTHSIESLGTSAPDGKMPVTLSGGVALVDPPSTARIPNNSGYVYGPVVVNASGTSGIELNRLFMYPLDVERCSIDAIQIYMNTVSTSGTQYLRLFLCSDVNGLPTDVLWQDVVAPANATLVTVLLPSPIPVQGWIWMGHVAQGASGYAKSDFTVRKVLTFNPRTPGLPWTSPLGATRNQDLGLYTGVIPSSLAGISFSSDTSNSYPSMGVRIA